MCLLPSPSWSLQSHYQSAVRLCGTLSSLSPLGSSYAPSWAAVLQEQEQIMGVAGMHLGAASAIPGKAN